MSQLKDNGVGVVTFVPTLQEDIIFDSCDSDFNEFKGTCDVFVVNRMSDELKVVEDKVYTKDVFS